MNKLHKHYKIIHHIRHTRPQWYHDYHKWEHHEILHWAAFTLSSLVMLMGFVNAVMLLYQYPERPASAASTTVNVSITGGSLTVGSQASANLTSVPVNAASSQNTTGSLGDVTVTDSRGTGVGWTASVTSSNFYYYNAPVKVSGSNNTLSLGTSTPYATSSAGTYTITIHTGGTVGVATFDVTGLEAANNVPTGSGSNIVIGTRGLAVNFGAATYVTGDSWTIRVDTIPVTGFQVAPGTVTTVSGSGTNVSASGTNTFTSTTSALLLMSASANYGMGQYTQNPGLTLTVPPETYANSYTATVTATAT